MRKILSLLLATGLTITALAGCSGSAPASSATPEAAPTGAPAADPTAQAESKPEADATAGYDKVELKISFNGTDTSTEAKVANLFAQKVEEASGGAVTVKTFPNAQLAGGDLSKSVEIATSGVTDLACWSQSVVAALDQGLFAAGMPWNYESYEDVEKVYDTTAGDYISKSLAKNGLRYISYAHNGLKEFTCGKRQIKTPEDLKNLKMRVASGAMNLDFYRALGADPVAMNWSEVYTALQQGTIDGHDNSLVTIKSGNINEVQDYITISKHGYDAFLFCANEDKMASLNQATQDLIAKTLTDACKEINQAFVTQEDDARKEFEAAGISIYELTPEDVAAFKTVVQPVIDKYKAEYGTEACTAFGVK